MRVLIVDHEKIVRNSLTAFIRSRGHRALSSRDWESAELELMRAPVDVICLGNFQDEKLITQRIYKLRQARYKGGIICLDDGSLRRLQMLDAGADEILRRSDLITSSKRLDELYHCILAIGRRWHGFASNIIEIGELSVDIEAQEVWTKKGKIHFTASEYSIIEALALNFGRILTKEQLAYFIYDRENHPEIKIIDVYILKIRRKLQNIPFGKPYLVTSWGWGYGFSLRKREKRTNRPNSTRKEMILA